MMLTRTNLATAPRPGITPATWSLPSTSTFYLPPTTGWDGQQVPCFAWRWPLSGTSADTLTTPMPGLRAGDRYCWFIAVQPNTDNLAVSVMGGPATVVPRRWAFLTGSFVATGTDVFSIAIVPPYSSAGNVVLFVDTFLLEDRHVGTSGRYFDGSLPGATWTSTPWSSTSSLTYDMDPVTLEPLSPFPLVVVEAAARPPQDWEFVLDRSSLDGPALLTDTPRWTPLRTAKQVDIRRGRDDDNSQVQAGTASLLFDNYDGLLDPDNPVSPYRPNPSETYLDRGCLLRVSSLGIANALQFTVSSLFTGRVQEWEPDVAWARTVSVSAVDDLAIVGTVEMPTFDTPIRGGDTTGDRARWVGQQVGLTVTVSAGATRTLLPLKSSGSLRTVLDQAGNAEGGRVYADSRGTIRLTVHADEYLKTPAVTITDTGGTSQANVDYESITTSSGSGQIVNQANVDRGSTVPAGEAQVVSSADLDSITRVGQQSVTIDAPLQLVSDATSLAAYLASRRSKRARRITGMQVNVAGQKPTWAQQCVRMDLGTHVVASRLVGYTTGARQITQRYSVERIAHTIRPTSWVVSFGFAPVDAQVFGTGAGAFLLDSSALDGLDVLTPY